MRKKFLGFAVVLFIASLLIIVFSCNKDNSPPVITVTGYNPYIHCIIQLQDTTIYTEYIDAGATAVDEEDGDLTSAISTSSNIDIHLTGTYQVTYSVKDKAGNEAIATRTVNVEYCK
jgi:hypothetical protein